MVTAYVTQTLVVHCHMLVSTMVNLIVDNVLSSLVGNNITLMTAL